MSIAHIIAQITVNSTRAATKPTTDMINAVFQNNIDAVVQSGAAVQGTMASLLLGLATLEFIWFAYKAYFNLSPDIEKSVGTLFVEKLASILIVAVIAFNWGGVANFLKGYIVGGASSAGGASQMVKTLNPAYIASEGVDKVAVIFNEEAREKMEQGLFGTTDGETAKQAAEARQPRVEAENQGYLDKFKAAVNDKVESNTPNAILGQLSDLTEQFALQLLALLLFATVGLLIVGVHFYVALQVFVLTLDWYITVSITQLLIPFAVNKHTSGLATAALQAVVRKSIQLGVLVMVLALFGKQIEAMQLGATPTFYELLALLLGVSTLAFMVSRVPQIANSIFAGAGSSIDVGSALQAGAAAVAGGAMALASSGSQFVSSPVKEGLGKGLEKAGEGIGDGARAVGTGLGDGIRSMTGAEPKLSAGSPGETESGIEIPGVAGGVVLEAHPDDVLDAELGIGENLSDAAPLFVGGDGYVNTDREAFDLASPSSDEYAVGENLSDEAPLFVDFDGSGNENSLERRDRMVESDKMSDVLDRNAEIDRQAKARQPEPVASNIEGSPDDSLLAEGAGDRYASEERGSMAESDRMSDKLRYNAETPQRQAKESQREARAKNQAQRDQAASQAREQADRLREAEHDRLAREHAALEATRPAPQTYTPVAEPDRRILDPDASAPASTTQRFSRPDTQRFDAGDVNRYQEARANEPAPESDVAQVPAEDFSGNTARLHAVPSSTQRFSKVDVDKHASPAVEQDGDAAKGDEHE